MWVPGDEVSEEALRDLQSRVADAQVALLLSLNDSCLSKLCVFEHFYPLGIEVALMSIFLKNSLLP